MPDLRLGPKSSRNPDHVVRSGLTKTQPLEIVHARPIEAGVRIFGKNIRRMFHENKITARTIVGRMAHERSCTSRKARLVLTHFALFTLAG